MIDRVVEDLGEGVANDRLDGRPELSAQTEIQSELLVNPAFIEVGEGKVPRDDERRGRACGRPPGGGQSLAAFIASRTMGASSRKTSVASSCIYLI